MTDAPTPDPRGAAGDVVSGDGAAVATGGTGVVAVFRKHPVAWTAAALGLAFILLAVGSFFAGVAVASGRPAPVPTASETAEPELPRPVPDSVAAPSRLRTCSIAGQAADPRLRDFYGQVVNAATQEVLWDRRGATPARTASVLKILTSAAALAVLGPGYQISTRVVDGGADSVALIGRGDATLSATPPGAQSFYRDAPKLSDLAAQTVASFAARHPGQKISSVTLDASYWSDVDKWDPSWERSEQTIGYHSEVTALQVDGDRADPARSTSPRSTDPIGRAGSAFISALHAADPGGVVASDVTAVVGIAPGGETLGEVKSQPLSVLIPQLLLPSDNTLAEMLARITSRESGHGGTAASLTESTTNALASYNIPTAGLVIRDGSGLSDLNAVPPAYLTKLLVLINGGGQNLDVIKGGLPVAGQSGSLASRFTGANAAARGAVLAKTGWIKSAYTLAGIINAPDGTPLTFAFYAIAPGISDNAKAALDTLTTGAWACGDNLSNN